MVTKKKVHWDYEHIVVPRGNWAVNEKAIAWDTYPKRKVWGKYYEQFAADKPSNGLMAVFVAIDIYQPDDICLIGFDNILDSVRATQHKWAAERKCIESLVKITDPRHGS